MVLTPFLAAELVTLSFSLGTLWVARLGPSTCTSVFKRVANLDEALLRALLPLAVVMFVFRASRQGDDDS